MIKKRLIMIMIIFFITINIFPKANIDNVTNELFMYVPTQEDINDFFNLFNYLIEWDKNKRNIKDEQLLNYYNAYIGQESFQGLLFEAFLRQTTNKKIQKQILKIIEENNYNDEFSKALYRLYNAKIKRYKQDGATKIQYNYNDGFFDENINLFYMYESLTFNKELGLMLFENDWSQMSYQPDKEEDNKRDSFFLLYGGGTNSMTIHFTRYSDMDFKEFKEEAINDKYNKEKYQNWEIKELNIEGILTRSGADKFYIGIGIGPDMIPEIDCGTFDVYLYNSKLKKGYEISYFMNFSKINNNYKIRHRIWNHLAMQLILTFINTEE